MDTPIQVACVTDLQTAARKGSKAHEAGRYVTTDYVGNQETNVYQSSTEPRKWKKPHSRLYYNITEEQYQLLSGPQ